MYLNTETRGAVFWSVFGSKEINSQDGLPLGIKSVEGWWHVARHYHLISGLVHREGGFIRSNVPDENSGVRGTRQNLAARALDVLEGEAATVEFNVIRHPLEEFYWRCVRCLDIASRTPRHYWDLEANSQVKLTVQNFPT